MHYSYLKSKSFLVPTALTVVFVLIFAILLQTGDTKYYSLARTLIQWDGQHYLSIARDGYQKFPCLYNADYICGNIGWFPLYPMLSRVFVVFGLDHSFALILTSWVALWLGMLLLFRLVQDRYDTRSAVVTLLALLVFPGSFYFLTAYPNSVYFLLVVQVFLIIDRGRLGRLWLPTGLLAVTHPSGIVMALPLLYLLVRNWRRYDFGARLSILGALAAMGLAIVLYFTYYWVRFGDFFLYSHFQAQSYYAHQVTLPFIPIVRLALQPLADLPVFIMLVFVTVAVVLAYTREIPVEWQVFMFALLLFSPTMGTTDSYFRYVQAAFPLYVMVGRLGRKRIGRYLLAFYGVVSVALTWLVFLGGYKAGLLR
jgi:hypothetical protein